MLKKIVFALMVLTLPAMSGAEQPLTYDRINFQVSAEREVENDTVTAALFAQREGREPERLADEVNKDITWAVERAKEVPAIKVESKGYQTFPVYAKQTLTGWRVRQTISLESMDTAALSTLLGQLQQRLAIQALGYSISPESRQTVEKQLIAEALSRFTERADMITDHLKRPEYRIVNLDINTRGGQPVYPMGRSAMVMAERASASPPTLEAGTDTLTVTVHGTIELRVR